MNDTALDIELHDPGQDSIWPWVFGGVAALLLVLSLRSEISHISNSLLTQASSLADSMKQGAIDASVDGRDITLNGTINKNADRDAFIASVESIEGARVVRDNLAEFDPEAQARLALSNFQHSLDGINTSAVAFEAGSASLTSGSEAALLQLVQLLRANPAYRIRISGHTDNTGRPEVNLRISRQRATAVARFLEDHNVDASRLIAQGYGATRPIADNSTEAGRSANRRIEISYVD